MNGLQIPEDYPYVYETHLHTSQASKCGSNTGSEMAIACKEAGYAGIIVTDHFYYGNTCVDHSLPWEDWVEGYCKGYEDAKACGDRIGLDVFFGWEAGYQGTEFLIYGLDKAWLKSHPEIKDATVEEQFKLVHDGGGIVIHAHPFREEFYIPEIRLYPDYVDGVERVNMAHLKPGRPEAKIFNDRAKAYAREHDFPCTGGSDIHCVNLFYGGMAFKRRLKDIHDFADAVMKREGVILPEDS